MIHVRSSGRKTLSLLFSNKQNDLDKTTPNEQRPEENSWVEIATKQNLSAPKQTEKNFQPQINRRKKEEEQTCITSNFSSSLHLTASAIITLTSTTITTTTTTICIGIQRNNSRTRREVEEDEDGGGGGNGARHRESLLLLLLFLFTRRRLSPLSFWGFEFLRVWGFEFLSFWRFEVFTWALNEWMKHGQSVGEQFNFTSGQRRRPPPPPQSVSVSLDCASERASVARLFELWEAAIMIAASLVRLERHEETLSSRSLSLSLSLSPPRPR